MVRLVDSQWLEPCTLESLLVKVTSQDTAEVTVTLNVVLLVVKVAEEELGGQRPVQRRAVGRRDGGGVVGQPVLGRGACRRVFDGEALTGAGVLRSGVVAPVGAAWCVDAAPAPRTGLVGRNGAGVSGRGGRAGPADRLRVYRAAHLGALPVRAGPPDRLGRVADEEGDGAGRSAIAGLVGLDDGVVGDRGPEGGRPARAGRWRRGRGGRDRSDGEALVGAGG